MKTYASILAGLLGVATALGIVTTPVDSAAKGQPKTQVAFKNTSKSKITCTVFRDDNGVRIGSITQEPGKTSYRALTVPNDRPLMFMTCPVGPPGMHKMRTKLSGKDIQTKGWSLSCDNTACRASVVSVQRA